MLFLVFRLDNDRYALPAKSVVEVVPMVSLKRLPQAPKGIAGVLNYRGTPVPAVDISQLALGRPALERLSTRLVIVRCSTSNGEPRLLGLIAEHATELLRKAPDSLAAAGVRIRGAPYLGPVFMDANGPIQLILEQHLLSEPVRERLFSTALPPIEQVPQRPLAGGARSSA